MEILIGALIAMAGAFGVFLFGKKEGTEQEYKRIDEEITKQKTENVAIKEEIKHEVSSSNLSDLVKLNNDKFGKSE